MVRQAFSFFFLFAYYLVVQGLVRWTWDLKVESLSPGRWTHVVFLGKTLNSQRLSPPRCINGNQKIALGNNLIQCWVVTCDKLVFHPGGIESRFILRKPEISAGPDEPSGSPNKDWGGFYRSRENKKHDILLSNQVWKPKKKISRPIDVSRAWSRCQSYVTSSDWFVPWSKCLLLADFTTVSRNQAAMHITVTVLQST